MCLPFYYVNLGYSWYWTLILGIFCNFPVNKADVNGLYIPFVNLLLILKNIVKDSNMGSPWILVSLGYSEWDSQWFGAKTFMV